MIKVKKIDIIIEMVWNWGGWGRGWECVVSRGGDVMLRVISMQYFTVCDWDIIEQGNVLPGASDVKLILLKNMKAMDHNIEFRKTGQNVDFSSD